MFSYRVISSWQKQRPRKRKNVFKLPPEVTNLVFYPLEEKKNDEKFNLDQSSSDKENIQQAVSEVLNRSYKNRTDDFYEKISNEPQEEEDIVLNENSNSTSQDENNIISLSLSNSVSFTYCNDLNQQETFNLKKINQKNLSAQFEKDSKNSIQEKPLENTSNEQIYQTEINIETTSDFLDKPVYNNNKTSFKRESHYFCTFPKRKPNPVTPDMKRKIGKQREFEGKFNYYEGDYSSDYDYEEDKDIMRHQKHHRQGERLNDYNKYDFNGHFRKKRHYSDLDENNDPRYYKPYIPETTINPRVVSEKRCNKILGKKNNKTFKTLPPKDHPQPFNYTNIFLPPKKFEKSIFYPPKFLYNLESEDSFLNHPNSPKLDKVRKYNNKLFESNIHFYDFDDLNYSPNPRNQTTNLVSSPEKNDIHYDLRRNGYQSHLHYYDKNSNNSDCHPQKLVNDHSQNLNCAKRFPENYLQSMANK